MKINLNITKNAQAKGMESLKSGNENLGYWLLERLKIRDPLLVIAIKNYVEGVKIIIPQARKIINEQKKLMPKYYKNSFYKRINSYSAGYSGCSYQATNQLASQIAKSLVGFQQTGKRKKSWASPF
jgi:hypothetical protein